MEACIPNDINTIFGAVINENLTDEVIVTVIATGFEKSGAKIEEPKKPEPQQVTTTRVSSIIQDDDDDDDDIPDFLKNRRSF